MNETLQVSPSANQHELDQIKEQARQAHTEGMDHLAQASMKLGHVMTGPVVHANGEVTTPRDRAEELRVRQENGHAYQR